MPPAPVAKYGFVPPAVSEITPKGGYKDSDGRVKKQVARFRIYAFDENGRLMVTKETSLNKVGHALHDLDPVFNRFSRQEKIQTISIILFITFRHRSIPRLNHLMTAGKFHRTNSAV